MSNEDRFATGSGPVITIYSSNSASESHPPSISGIAHMHRGRPALERNCKGHYWVSAGETQARCIHCGRKIVKTMLAPDEIHRLRPAPKREPRAEGGA